MTAGWNYVMDANRYLGYAKSIESNKITEQSSQHKQDNTPASGGTELDTVLVMGKRPPYQERKDVRFFEYENLRDIADFAADDEQRQAIDEYLGSKNYQYTNQPWHAKPYIRSPGRNLSNIHIGKPMEDTASPINLSNPFSEYYRIVFNEQQRNFIEQTGKSAGTAVLKTLLEPALEVSDLTNAGRNIILGRNEYPTNMSALGEHVQQGAGTGKALLFVGQNVALTAIGARFPKISIGAGTLYGSHTIVSGIQENNPEKTGEGIAVLGGSTLGGYTYGLGRRFKIEWGEGVTNRLYGRNQAGSVITYKVAERTNTIIGKINPTTGHEILGVKYEPTYGQADFIIEGSKPSTRNTLIRPQYYENPGHHDPRGGNVNYNPSKSVLSINHVELWERSILGSDGNRWAVEIKGKTVVYHRFQNDRNGNFHWNGATNGKTLTGVDRSDVGIIPSEIRNKMEVK